MKYIAYLRLNPVEVDYSIEAKDVDDVMDKIEDVLASDKTIPKDFKSSYQLLCIQDDSYEYVYRNTNQEFLDEYEESYWENH